MTSRQLEAAVDAELAEPSVMQAVTQAYRQLKRDPSRWWAFVKWVHEGVQPPPAKRRRVLATPARSGTTIGACQKFWQRSGLYYYCCHCSADRTAGPSVVACSQARQLFRQQCQNRSDFGDWDTVLRFYSACVSCYESRIKPLLNIRPGRPPASATTPRELSPSLMASILSSPHHEMPAQLLSPASPSARMEPIANETHHEYDEFFEEDPESIIDPYWLVL